MASPPPFNPSLVAPHVASVLASFAEETSSGATPRNYAPGICSDPNFPIAQYLDHTLLHPAATPQMIKEFCHVGIRAGVKVPTCSSYVSSPYTRAPRAVPPTPGGSVRGRTMGE